jgi:hypothetical protein
MKPVRGINQKGRCSDPYEDSACRRQPQRYDVKSYRCVVIMKRRIERVDQQHICVQFSCDLTKLLERLKSLWQKEAADSDESVDIGQFGKAFKICVVLHLPNCNDRVASVAVDPPSCSV